MSEHQDDPEIFWVDPARRGILPIDGFHISRSLKKVILNSSYDVRFNSNFDGVVRACADREETWINDTIFEIYGKLFKAGYAHSQEIWDGDDLVGGVYGIALGAAFFGESMFSRSPNGSKIALAYLVDRLRLNGFTLFDTQFITPHLQTMGAIEIDRSDYLERLEQAIDKSADITSAPISQTPYDVVQRNTQTS